MKEIFYDSKVKRVIMRFAEIFVLTGIAACIGRAMDWGYIPIYFVPVAEAILKALREYTE